MPAPDFIDTNILVYAYDAGDQRKQQIAQDILRRAIAGEFVVSMQVFAEFAATLLHKVSPPANPENVADLLAVLTFIPAIAPDAEMITRAVEARLRYGIHFYDGMIIAAAERTGCARIWSEDLNPGQSYFGVVVENPFL